MAIKVSDELEDNPLGDMVELRCEAQIEQQIFLLVDLRMATIDVPFSETVYRVGLSGAYLRVALEGLKPLIGKRIGDINPLQSSITKESRAEKDAKASATISAFLSGRIDAKCEIGGKAEVIEQTGLSSSYEHPGIRALPNNCWRVENPKAENDPIQATILNGDRLLALKRIENGNRMVAEMTVDAAPSEIVVTSKTRRRKIRQINRERVIQVIANRSLMGRAGTRLEGGTRIQISKVNLEFQQIDDD